MACAQRRGACGALMPQLGGASKHAAGANRTASAPGPPGDGRGRAECPHSQAPLSLGSLLHGNRSTGRNFRFMLEGGTVFPALPMGPLARQPERSVLQQGQLLNPRRPPRGRSQYDASGRSEAPGWVILGSKTRSTQDRAGRLLPKVAPAQAKMGGLADPALRMQLPAHDSREQNSSHQVPQTVVVRTRWLLQEAEIQPRFRAFRLQT